MIENARRMDLRGNRLWLLPQRALYWQKKKMLLVADLHIGKSGHFRKHGIPVPGTVNRANLEQLDQLIEQLAIQHLVILGDLFHSGKNREWDQFDRWRKKHLPLELSLVLGNHDILPKSFYHASRINLFKKLKADPFLMIHDLQQLNGEQDRADYLLSGHIHPAVKLRGKARQSMKLPCFYFGKQQGVLPAFGHFTGTHVIKPQPDDRVYAIVNQRVVPIKTAR